jgi:hypothetical protein
MLMALIGQVTVQLTSCMKESEPGCSFTYVDASPFGTNGVMIAVHESLIPKTPRNRKIFGCLSWRCVIDSRRILCQKPV